MELIDMWTLSGLRNQSTRTAIRLLEHRFGAVPPEMAKAIENLPLPALEDLAVAVLDFGSIADAEAWIAQHHHV